MEVRYKRFLIINDDDNKEHFFAKYKNLKKYEEEIEYCNNQEKAFEYITQDNFGGFDRIVLDIKLDWMIPEKYIEKISKYVDKGILNDTGDSSKVNLGFVLFMYLISRRYPINRIAFLSAYIEEEDDELERKKKILDKMKKWTERKEEYDEELKREIIGLEDESKFKKILDKCKNINAYNRIIKILEENIETEVIEAENIDRKGIEGDEELRKREINSNKHFFDLIRRTGLKVENKIPKKDEDKLVEWIESDKGDEGEYYKFRSMALNLCEFIAGEIHKKANETDKDKKKINIYVLDSDVKRKYELSYFENLFRKVQNDFFEVKEAVNINDISKNIINEMVAFWEGMPKKLLDVNKKEETVYDYAMTMVLKHTRNWYAHNMISETKIQFCEFIFLLSIRAIYGKDESGDLEKYINKKFSLYKVKAMEKENYEEIWKELNRKLRKSGKRKDTYIIDLVNLYHRYSNTVRPLSTCDLYRMFLLCLHFPDVSIDDDINVKGNLVRIIFNENSDDDNIQELYLKLMEKIAIKNMMPELYKDC